ncbi:hypothetical protein LOTGIDRAFT_230092 [Lottia gigantea]|uniref:Kinetochore protein Spc24 n=1 Tax=Lottia gigantea TaxID=225164 RepID=V4CN07_LOTGI|nr:hypothetical protein LOTGIDRAFT_230092 [Lottia gigantea]ESP03760.1 hypothetical protein LOTGIDRAFT_230092 [Lottia gigantea]
MSTSEENEYEECTSNATEALLVVTSDHTDFAKKDQLQELWDSINEVKQRTQERLQNEIQNLQNMVEKAETEEKQENVERKEEKLITQCEEMKIKLDEISSDCEKYQKKVAEEEKEKDILKKLLEEVSKNKSYSLPKAKYNVKLYSNISRIRWQSDSNSDEIKGYICNKDDIQPFCFNTKTHSQYYITNSLWGLMKEDW